MALITADNLIHRWDQKACVLLHNIKKNRGDYVEKWYTLHLSQIVVHVVISKFNLLFDCALYKVIN